MDTAQARPGDALEYTAGAGGAAYLVGPADEALAVFEGSFSYATDTTDFWRRAHQHYPSHGGRFTGRPAYFRHSLGAARGLMDALGTEPSDYAHAVFHQPNAKFPRSVAKQLGFTREQIGLGLLANDIGNAYAGSALLGLTAVLDAVAPDDRVLLVSYGSGAGSDAFSLRVTEEIAERQRRAPLTQEYVARRTEVDYGTYVRFVRKLKLK
jgi:hydroxymethylglutaryl-CoA synthase